MASYDDAIRIPPKPEGMGWSEHVYRVISAQPIETDFMGERVKPALRFSQDDFDDLIRSMEPYMVPVEGEVPATKTMFGHLVIVDAPPPSKETESG